MRHAIAAGKEPKPGAGHFLRDHTVDEEPAVLLHQDNIAGGDLVAILALYLEDIMRPQRGQHASPEHLQMKVVSLAQNFRHETTLFRAVSPRFRIHEEPITNSYGETDSVSASRRFFRTRAPWFQTPARTGMKAAGKASCRSAACQPLAFHRSSLPFGSCIPTLHCTRISR